MAIDNDGTVDDRNNPAGGDDRTSTGTGGGDDATQVEGLDKGAFGNEDLDAALSKFMDGTDTKPRPPAAGTQQGGEGQQVAGEGDNRPRDAQGRFVEGDAQKQDAGTAQQPRGAQPTQAPTGQQIPQGARRFGANYWSDERGNIFDAKGQMVAPQGAGHAQFRRTFPYIESLEREVASTKQRMQAFEDANQLARAANLSLDDQGAALQLMVQWRKDPKATIKTLLQHAQTGGIDVSDIQQGAGGIDANTMRTAVKELLAEALAPFQPIVEQNQRQREHEEAFQAATQEHTEFLQTFPDAEPHQGAIANVMRDKNLSAREAYLTLRAFAAEQRYDFTKDLAPQIVARQQQGNGQQRRAPNGGGNRPLPDMSGRNGSSDATVRSDSRQPASADASWDSIAETTLAAFGLGRG